MYRTFLSLRYLIARRTNLIGVVGILVGVAALITILAIMTGFLEMNRDMIRGSLSDVIVEPSFHKLDPEHQSRQSPRPIQNHLAGVEGVEAATPQLVWGGILSETGRTETDARYMSDPTLGSLLLVQLVGVDVRTAERILAPGLRASILAVGGVPPPLEIQDEFDTTELLAALQRDGGEFHIPVTNPLFPFGRPAGYDPWGRELGRALIGQHLARDLGLTANQVIEITTAVPDASGRGFSPNTRKFVVAGTFLYQDNELDRGRIYLERGELADFLGGDRPYSQILVRLSDYDADGHRIREELLTGMREQMLIKGEQLEVRTWEQFRVTLMKAIENERILMGIMLSLVLLVAGFSVFAILSMMVIEKRRDIGILCALGATPRGILQVFLLIAFWDALLGSILGTITGIWLARNIDPIEMWLSDLLGHQIFNRNVYLFDHIPSRIDPVAVVLIVIGAFVCTILFAAIPAWRAARMDPLEALRYE